MTGRGKPGGRRPGGAPAGALAGILLVGLYLAFVHGAASPGDPSGQAAGHEAGERDGTPTAPAAPLASSQAFPTVEGGEASLADLRGQVVLLNLWGTWCPPCIREIPHLVEVQEAIAPRGGIVVGLAVDSGSSDDIRAFWRDRLELDPSYPIWMGSNREARQHFDAFGLPNTLVIDREGRIQERFLGLMTRDALLDVLEAYL